MTELEHYGIKDQKWGTRRFQYEDGTLTPEGKIRYLKGTHGTFHGQDRDKDIRIKANSEAYRVQEGSNFNGKGQTYVSFDKLDHMKYLATTASGDDGGLIVDMQDGKGTSLKLKLNKDIIAPSYENTMRAFIRTIDAAGGAKKAFNDFAHDPSRQKEEAKQFIKNYKHMKIDDARDQAYITFCGSFMRDSKTKKIFFDMLKEQGYNAIVDDWDAQFGKGYTKDPMIVFDKSNLTKTKATRISDEDMKYFSDIVYNGGMTKLTAVDRKWNKYAGTKEWKKDWEIDWNE